VQRDASLVDGGPLALRLATWNLARTNPRSTARIQTLQSHMATINADIWILTETWKQIAPPPEHHLVATSTPAPDRESAAGERWTTIWSRHPAQALTLAAEPDRTAAALITPPNSRPIIVYGTVLPWLSDQRRAPVTGGDAFIASLAAQSEEWRDLRTKHLTTGLIVAGDFNQDLAEKHYYGSGRGRRTGLLARRRSPQEPERSLWCLGRSILERLSPTQPPPPYHPR